MFLFYIIMIRIEMDHKNNHNCFANKTKIKSHIQHSSIQFDSGRGIKRDSASFTPNSELLKGNQILWKVFFSLFLQKKKTFFSLQWVPMRHLNLFNLKITASTPSLLMTWKTSIQIKIHKSYFFSFHFFKAIFPIRAHWYILQFCFLNCRSAKRN